MYEMFVSKSGVYCDISDRRQTDKRGVVPVPSGGSELDVQGSDSKLFAALSDVLSSQHGGIW